MQANPNPAIGEDATRKMDTKACVGSEYTPTCLDFPTKYVIYDLSVCVQVHGTHRRFTVHITPIITAQHTMQRL